MKNIISNMVRNSVAAFAMLSLLALPAFSVKAADLSGYSYSYSYPSSGYSYSYSYPSTGSSYSYSYPSYSYSYPEYNSYSYSYSYPETSGYSYSYSYPEYDSGYSYSYSYPEYDSGYSYSYSYPTEYSYPNYYSGTTYYGGGYSGSGSYYGGSSYYGGGTTYYGGGNYYGGCKKNCEPEKPKPAPWCDMWVSDSQVEKGDRVTLYWESDNVEDVRINKGIGRVDTEGSEKVRITENTTFVGTFEGKNGKEITCSATVSVDRDYIPPKHYPKTPYVTLNEVPYTGIDLGPVGNFVYWAFLIFWCLFGAYLIVVKRVQNNIYRSLKELLFGEEEKTVTVSYVTPIGKLEETVTFVPPASDEKRDIDPFIASQINRS